ncbi:MAG: arginine repressor [Clostridiales bacterium]|jgi:transcriptional regulator of arginine metabolism|nr:arginine repressor [Clostridiales bacterium]
MSRHFRQAKILELIEKNPVQTQDELADSLRLAGFNITQATVSRDIKELGLIKAPYGDSSRYTRDSDRSVMMHKIKEIFKVSVMFYEQVDHTVVLKTLHGMANAASVLIDQLNFEGVVGCISGLDTVFVLVRTKEQGKQLLDKIEQIIND